VERVIRTAGRIQQSHSMGTTCFRYGHYTMTIANQNEIDTGINITNIPGLNLYRYSAECSRMGMYRKKVVMVRRSITNR